MAGTFAEDLELVRRLRARPSAIGAVAAGLGMFGAELGRMAEGILGPSQWEEGLRSPIDVGPRQAEVLRSLRARVFATLRAGAGPGHVEYPTAQAYAAGLLAMHCVEEAANLEDDALRSTPDDSGARRSSAHSDSTPMVGGRNTRCWLSNGRRW